MKRSYNHIQHVVDNKGVITSDRGPLQWQDVKHDANQMDDKQCHTGFDYYEYDMMKFGAVG